MDTKRTADPTLANALQAVRAYGIAARQTAPKLATDAARPDAFIELRYGPDATIYAAEIKRAPQPVTIGVVLARLAHAGPPPLLVADYVTPTLAEKLKENNLAFIDAAGNAYLKQPGLFLWVKGNRPAARYIAREVQKRYVARAFEPAGLKVLFAFLCEPDLVYQPFRKIADKADVAHGTVGEVMAELPHGGFVYDFGKTAGGRKLTNPESLLTKWADVYARKLKPKLFIGRYRAQKADWWKELNPATYGMVFGAEPAAAKITRHLKPAIITLYGDRAEPRLIVDHALRADPNGDVEIAKRFWRVETEEEKQGFAPLPLIYADLLATGDPRCIETAGMIRERYLARFEHKT